MNSDQEKAVADSDTQQPDGRRELSPAARRALQEAAERRRKMDQSRAENRAQRELGGQEGPDPVRYGDWEKGGIISDF